ncbi:hypothetical protein KY310_03365 [Candidatus Woesearchaeota archaeon]|nr:hypothetical protein [Candidatus Woesearchaeota archaeon]
MPKGGQDGRHYSFWYGRRRLDTCIERILPLGRDTRLERRECLEEQRAPPKKSPVKEMLGAALFAVILCMMAMVVALFAGG